MPETPVLCTFIHHCFIFFAKNEIKCPRQKNLPEALFYTKGKSVNADLEDDGIGGAVGGDGLDAYRVAFDRFKGDDVEALQVTADLFAGGFRTVFQQYDIVVAYQLGRGALDLLGGTDGAIVGTDERNVTVISKIKPTPVIYPRKAGSATRNPLVKPV